MKYALFIGMALCALSVSAQKPGAKAPAKKPAAAGTTAKKPVTGNNKSSAKSGSMETTPSGLKLQIFSSGSGRKVKVGDLINLHMVIKTDKDSVLMTSYGSNGPSQGKPLQIEVAPSQSPGDLMEAFVRMSKGDSAIAKVPTDSIFKGSVADKRPPFLKPGSSLVYNVKIVDVTNPADLAAKEKSDMEKYIKDNKLNVQHTASGMYYVIEQEGTGEQPKAGDEVVVHYIGKLLDGSEFDQSYKRGQPFTFKLGAGQVIKGWDEGIALLKKGSKAKLIIPSSLGYGARGAGAQIPPYSPLVFEVELVDIKK